MQSWKELKRLLKAKKIKDAQILSEKTEILENLEAKNPEFASFRKEAQKIASAKKVLTGDIIRKPLYIAKRAIKAWDCQGLTSDQALYAKTAYSYYLLKNQSPLVISNYVKSFREVYKAWKSGLELPDMCGKVFRKIWKELGGDFDKAEGEFAKSLLGKLAPAKSLMDLVKDAFNVSDDLLLKELVENSDLETSKTENVKTENSNLEIPKTETSNLDEIDLDSMSPEEILALQNELEDFLGISADTAEHAEEHTEEYTKEDVEKEFKNLDDEIDNVIGSLSKMIDPNVLEELESEFLKSENVKTENSNTENVNSELKNAKTEFENIETELEQMLGSLSDIVKSENSNTENANLELKNTDFEISKLKNANLELKNLKTEFKNLKNTNFEISRSQNVLRNLVRTTLFEGNYAKEPRIFLRERSPP